MDPLVRFAIRGRTLSGNYALLATVPQRRHNPFRARITGEDEIHNQGRRWPFTADVAYQENGSGTHPSRFVPRQSHLQFSLKPSCPDRMTDETDRSQNKQVNLLGEFERGMAIIEGQT